MSSCECNDCHSHLGLPPWIGARRPQSGSQSLAAPLLTHPNKEVAVPMLPQAESQIVVSHINSNEHVYCSILVPLGPPGLDWSLRAECRRYGHN